MKIPISLRLFILLLLNVSLAVILLSWVAGKYYSVGWNQLTRSGAEPRLLSMAELVNAGLDEADPDEWGKVLEGFEKAYHVDLGLYRPYRKFSSKAPSGISATEKRRSSGRRDHHCEERMGFPQYGAKEGGLRLRGRMACVDLHGDRGMVRRTGGVRDLWVGRVGPAVEETMTRGPYRRPALGRLSLIFYNSSTLTAGKSE